MGVGIVPMTMPAPPDEEAAEPHDDIPSANAVASISIVILPMVFMSWPRLWLVTECRAANIGSALWSDGSGICLQVCCHAIGEGREHNVITNIPFDGRNSRSGICGGFVPVRRTHRSRDACLAFTDS